MGSVAFVARSQARRRWRALVVLVLLVGVLGGLSLSLIAGARRSASVVDRFLATSNQYDVELYTTALSLDDVRAIPGVVRADPGAYVGMVAMRRDGSSGQGINGNALDFSALDPTWRIVDGDRPDGTDRSEVLVNEFFVEQFGRSVGDPVDVRMFAKDQAGAVSRGVYDAAGPRYRFRIAGVVRPPTDVAVDAVEGVGVSSAGSANGMGIDYRFYERNREDFLDFGSGFSIQLADGETGRDAFVQAVRARMPADAEPPEIGPPQELVRRVSLTTPVDLETNVLLVLGISLAVATAIALGLVLRAEQRTFDVDTPTLRTLGVGVVHLGAIALVRALPVVIGGAALAVLVAVALSARYPIGIGRQLELDGGIDLNIAVLVIGGVAIGVLVVGLSFVLGLPRRDRRRPATDRLTLARWLGRAGAPTDLVLGTQFAFERGRGVRSVPSRAAIAVGAGALAVLAAVAVYVAGVDRLYSVPEAHGWRWDAAIGNTNFPLTEATVAALADDERVSGRTRASYGDASVNDRPTEFLVVDPRGGAPPEILAGRLPETSSEVALGSAVLDDLGVQVGDVVRFSVAGTELAAEDRAPTRRMRVVGEALLPVFGEADVGDAGLVTYEGLEAAGGDVTPNYVLVTLRDDGSGALASIRRDYTEEMITDTVPARIVNLHRVRRLPLLGIVVAGFLGTVVMVYTLAITARARSREVAVLRALGLESRRVRGVLAWQGGVLGLGVLVIGLPLGLLLGISVWNRVADGLGVDMGAVLSPWLLLLVPLALLVALAASIVPARRARRAPVADLLHAE
jgi:hypothetical protein